PEFDHGDVIAAGPERWALEQRNRAVLPAVGCRGREVGDRSRVGAFRGADPVEIGGSSLLGHGLLGRIGRAGDRRRLLRPEQLTEAGDRRARVRLSPTVDPVEPGDLPVDHAQKSTGAGSGSTSASTWAPIPSFSLIRFSIS